MAHRAGVAITDAASAQRFERLVLPHLDSAFNVARWLTRNDQDAQDVVQEALLRAFRFSGGLRGDDGRAWLLSIVRNTFRSWYAENRKHAGESTEFEDEEHSGRHADPVTGLTPEEHGPEAMFIRAQNQRRVHDALSLLRLEYREVIVLRELEELSYKEIAMILDIPMGTVMSRLGRGRQQLAALLAPAEREA
ncbi:MULTISPECIES: sigma-70 family RNA polymerase sigma factor [unclassified Achromobacter]|uniref:sigma-70 family RNA polymerase sigma factor n=1 Tax=unclassified Achromobacter TaxID=2626865 RepID=UPI000B519304|nr:MULTISPECIES: sigma-70 family RNA polymerase sigma factor [unclassified Achromobacter]OWT77291.1 RNA polymerase subunit sigma [Achromobacter sp. HZ28]OWT78172.1 RNA polymerase subunit sigma [Achromobacter sp. HZ34]